MVLGQRRFDDAPAALSAAEEPEQALADDHPLRLGLRGRALRAQLEIGESAAVHAALVGKLALAGEGSAPAVYPGPAAIEALLLDAAANDRIGDCAPLATRGGARSSSPSPMGSSCRSRSSRWAGCSNVTAGTARRMPRCLTTILDMLAGGSVQPETEPLREPLSDAELRVVRHLPSNLKATQIAADLCVSPNTVRTHMRHIYANLDANTRSEAVTRARRLRLLAPRPTGSAGLRWAGF